MNVDFACQSHHRGEVVTHVGFVYQTHHHGELWMNDECDSHKPREPPQLVDASMSVGCGSRIRHHLEPGLGTGLESEQHSWQCSLQ